MSSTPWPIRWSPRWPLLISVTIHGALLSCLVWLFAVKDQGTVTREVSNVGIAMAVTLPERTRYSSASVERRDEQDNDVSQDSDASMQSASADRPPPISAPFDLDAVLNQMLDPVVDGDSPINNAGPVAFGQAQFGDGVSLDSIDDDAIVAGPARYDAGAGRTTTSLFGVSGSGSTFVYVFDRSESMRGAALRRAKSELIRSLSALTERQQFQVIFYHHQPRPFTIGGRSPNLQLAAPATLDAAKQFIASISATGSTDHAAALRMAIRLAPDVIFFLTDARIQTMSDRVIAELTRRAERAGSVIHGIQFGDGPTPANPFVRKLTSRNNGGYQYLDVGGF
ncbi:MAG: VWA domain-containing protein [Planctomycetota bacterium]